MDFIAIDFETANSNYNSACSLGLVVVENLEIVKKEHYLIHPPTLDFSGIHIGIHGIRPDDVADQPKFPEIWKKIKHYFSGECPIAAHNANFDMSVLRCCLNTYELDIPDFSYVDSITLSNPQCPDCKAKLSVRAEFLGVTLEHHHDGLEDAAACAGIITTCIKKAMCSNFEEYIASFDKNVLNNFRENKSLEHVGGGSSSKKKTVTGKKRDGAPIALAEYTCDPNIEEHPFVGKNFVLTGDLNSMSREHATQEIVNCGGLVKSAVSKKTNFLVVGSQNISVVGEDGLSSKQEKANAIIEKGGEIKIISEEDFLSYLDDYPRFVKSEATAYLIFLKHLGMIPMTATALKQIYYRNSEGVSIPCKINKIVSEAPQIVEISVGERIVNIHLDFLKEMQLTKKEQEELNTNSADT